MKLAASAPDAPLSDLHDTLEKISGLGTWRFVFATQRLTWSGGVYDLLGIDRWSETPSYELFRQCMYPEDRTNFDSLAEYLRKLRSLDREFRVIQPDGRTKWVAHKAEVFLDEKGDCAFAIGILLDITRLKEAVLARDISEERLRTIIEGTRAFTWRVDAAGLKPCSPGWTELTGQPPEQSGQLGWLSAIFEEDREKVKSAWSNASKTRTAFAVKYRLNCRDAKLRWFVVRYSPEFDAATQLVGWSAVGVDISDVTNPSEPFLSPKEVAQIDGAMFRAARAMLDWSVETFSSKSGLSVSSIRRLENEAQIPTRTATSIKALNCLLQHGIEFCRLDDQGSYVRLRRHSKP